MDLKEVEKAWTGTVIKYTKWATFIGCGRSQSTLKSGISVKTAEDCLIHCSDDSSVTYFIIKSSTCYCLTYKPEINGDINDCRAECSNASYTPCSSGRSALVFSIVQGTISRNDSCLAVSKAETKYFAVEDCSCQFPFLCLGSQETNEEVNDSGYKELSDNVTQLRANRHDGIMDTSEDTMDSQGYLIPEQHYHTIPGVEVHYAAANITERNSDKEKEVLDRDDYLVPVT
ncbi:unnamed protein product [Mytilus coruscus]|uniref:WSC domain-containing protein n=1 Tax=Mytilus coruscus TaxID=42192 RepID=A0A6J8EZ76_MYTCO|nr:unnamed protein product [Mytilus coruscus]